MVSGRGEVMWWLSGSRTRPMCVVIVQITAAYVTACEASAVKSAMDNYFLTLSLADKVPVTMGLSNKV